MSEIGSWEFGCLVPNWPYGIIVSTGVVMNIWPEEDDEVGGIGQWSESQGNKIRCMEVFVV